MALVKFGNGVAAMSGRIDGTVFSRVRGGAIARGWTKPTSTPTALQVAFRAQFAEIAGAWQSIGEAARATWNAAALTAERKNRLGETYTPSGRQMFMEANKNLALADMTPAVVAPPNWLLPSPPISVEVSLADATTGVLVGLEIDLDPPSDAAMGQKYIVEMTPAFAPETKTNLTNLYRLVYYGASGAAIDVLSLYDSIFGSAVTIGQAINVRASSVDTSGMRSTFVEGKGVIATAP